MFHAKAQRRTRKGAKEGIMPLRLCGFFFAPLREIT
jgi:hypothetical protein